MPVKAKHAQVKYPDIGNNKLEYINANVYTALERYFIQQQGNNCDLTIKRPLANKSF